MSGVNDSFDFGAVSALATLRKTLSDRKRPTAGQPRRREFVDHRSGAWVRRQRLASPALWRSGQATAIGKPKAKMAQTCDAPSPRVFESQEIRRGSTQRAASS